LRSAWPKKQDENCDEYDVGQACFKKRIAEEFEKALQCRVPEKRFCESIDESGIAKAENQLRDIQK
jgi:hypothetical protein